VSPGSAGRVGTRRAGILVLLLLGAIKI